MQFKTTESEMANFLKLTGSHLKGMIQKSIIFLSYIT